MLQQRSAAVHIQELQAATDAKHGNAATISGIKGGPLQRIARRLNADSAINGFVVSRRINVGTTGKE
jgi:hypothetical protein